MDANITVVLLKPCQELDCCSCIVSCTEYSVQDLLPYVNYTSWVTNADAANSNNCWPWSISSECKCMYSLAVSTFRASKKKDFDEIERAKTYCLSSRDLLLPWHSPPVSRLLVEPRELATISLSTPHLPSTLDISPARTATA